MSLSLKMITKKIQRDMEYKNILCRQIQVLSLLLLSDKEMWEGRSGPACGRLNAGQGTLFRKPLSVLTGEANSS